MDNSERRGQVTVKDTSTQAALKKLPRTKNRTEAKLAFEMHSAGFSVLKRGWPDFFCIKDGRVVLVEVKPDESHQLKAQQYLIMEALSQYGVPCYYWSPDTGFVPVGNTEPMRDKDANI